MAWRKSPNGTEDAGRQPQEACSGLRTFIVPPDIIPVKRRSPPPIRKRTPWHPQPDGTPTEHPGRREWFDDRLFVEPERANERAGYGTSIALHVTGAVLLVMLLVARPQEMVLVTNSSPIVMPARAVLLAAAVRTGSDGESHGQSAPRRAPIPTAPPLARAIAAAPIEVPPVVAPESAVQSRAAGEAEGGVEGGIAGGVPGGIVGGVPGQELGGPGMLGPLQVGTGGIGPPRKIKDVKPVYPQDAMTSRARGVVVIEAVIGIDGKIKEAKVLSSVPLLDQAALDAVRRWEYAPTILNGSAVAVVMTIVVNFAIQ